MSEKPSPAQTIDQLCDEFDSEWAEWAPHAEKGTRPSISAFLEQCPESVRDELLENLIPIDVEYRQTKKESVKAADYLSFGAQALAIASRAIQEIRLDNDPESAVDAHPSNSGSTKIGSHTSQTFSFASHRGDKKETLANRYRMLRQIRQGNLGRVWLADDQESSRSVALKILPLYEDMESLKEKLNSLANRLDSVPPPKVVQIQDYGLTANQRVYLALDLADGQPLVRFCERECLTLPERLNLFIEVADGVSQLHEKKMVHGDLSGLNVLVSNRVSSRQTTFADVGLADVFSQFQSIDDPHLLPARRLQTSVLMGAAPEVLKGAPIDVAADVFSLGLILCELVCGKNPRLAIIENLVLEEKLKAIEDGKQRSPSELLRDDTSSPIEGIKLGRLRKTLRNDLDWIVNKASAKNPSERYVTADDLIADLKRVQEGEPILARPSTPTYRFRKWVDRTFRTKR